MFTIVVASIVVTKRHIRYYRHWLLSTGVTSRGWEWVPVRGVRALIQVINIRWNSSLST